MQLGQTISGTAASARSFAAASAIKSAPAKSTSDEVLLDLIAAGDKDAVRLLFARHNVRIYRFLLRILGNEATAEDVLNEVFVDVWRQAARYQRRSRVTTWILGIARFKALTALRQRSFDELDEEAVERIEDTSDDPEVSVHKSERGAILQDCLKRLSPAHRQVIDLIYYHEESIEDVARIVGVPQNTVKTRVFHARKRIAEMMAARGIGRALI